jgi:hypothetical protein
LLDPFTARGTKRAHIRERALPVRVSLGHFVSSIGGKLAIRRTVASEKTDDSALACWLSSRSDEIWLER